MQKPVIVAVDYKTGSSNKDSIGDHFVIIVGRDPALGYHYFDPATANQERGTSMNNMFLLQNNKLVDSNSCTGETKYYTVTSIRINN